MRNSDPAAVQGWHSKMALHFFVSALNVECSAVFDFSLAGLGYGNITDMGK